MFMKRNYLFLCFILIQITTFAQIISYPLPENDPAGIASQLIRALGKQSWEPGNATVSFKLNEMNHVSVVNVQSKNEDLAKKLAAHLRGIELFPKLDGRKNQYQYVFFFPKKKRPKIIGVSAF